MILCTYIFLQNGQLNMKPAGEAFSKHHLEAMVFVDNCNVILKQQRQLYLNPEDPGLPSDELGCSALCAAILGGGMDDELTILDRELTTTAGDGVRREMDGRQARD